MKDKRTKVEQVKDLAIGSVFFPFTEPTVYNPVTGRQVSGRKMKKFDVKKLIGGENNG